MESKTTTESSDRRFALLIDADNVSARYLKPILNELSKYGTVTIKRIYGDWTLTLHAKWKDALLENSITPIQQFGYTQGKNATDSAMIIDAMDILYTDNVDGFCLVSSDSDFTRLASRLRESGRMVIGMGEKKTPTPFRRACDVFTTLELLVQNKRNEKGGGGNAVPKDSVEQAVVDIITDNQNNGKATGLGEIGSRLQKRYPDFDVRSYGTNLLSKLLEEFTRVRITKDHSSVTVELAEGEERTEKAEKPERSGKPEKAAKAAKAAKAEEAADVASELDGEAAATEASSAEAEKPEMEKPEKPNRRSRSHRGTRRVATKAVGRLSEGRQAAAALPEGEAEQSDVSTEVAVEVPASEAVEVVVEAAPEVLPESEEAQKDVRPGRRARAERKTRQTKKADATEEAKARETKEPTEVEKPAETEKPTRRRQAAKSKAEENPAAKKTAAKKETAKKTAAKKNTAKKEAPQKAPARKKKPAGDTPAGYIRELVAGAGAEGIMLSTITDALRAKFKDFKVRDLGYSQMRQYMASVGDYELEKSGRNFRVRLSQ
ncbi:NYN domain-containing protein [uncultured Adlercreutzia sp.]|uniref:NYN domain-containing protein n=1 Tax=uncultured Adlercreutzia sp. TaxID=875803 RepID=UPI0025888450|nr:NYN domain-containing protein [uncultured Adlercreutzia sp.]